MTVEEFRHYLEADKRRLADALKTHEAAGKSRQIFKVEFGGSFKGRNATHAEKLLAQFGGLLLEHEDMPILLSGPPKTRLAFSVPVHRLKAAKAALGKANVTKRVTHKRHKAAPEPVTDSRHKLATERFPTIECANCGEQFLGRRSDAATCSPKCRTALYRKRGGARETKAEESARLEKGKRLAAKLQKVWLADHSGKTEADYEKVSTCAATKNEADEFGVWFSKRILKTTAA